MLTSDKEQLRTEKNALQREFTKWQLIPQKIGSQSHELAYNFVL